MALTLRVANIVEFYADSCRDDCVCITYEEIRPDWATLTGLGLEFQACLIQCKYLFLLTSDKTNVCVCYKTSSTLDLVLHFLMLKFIKIICTTSVPSS
jgi:hypothetical protein